MAAFHAGCPRILVLTGLGRRALEDGLPQYVEPVAVHDDLAAAVDTHLRNLAGRRGISPGP
jgi:D-glycero-D-manno-heptose 1,7-bisphosphate phosphatase